MTAADPIELRYRAVNALSVEDRDAVRQLMEYLGDSNWRIRKAALARLDEFVHRPTLLVDLIAGLGHETNAGLRNACMEGLLRYGESVEPLIAALSTKNANQRKIIAEILGQFGTDRARDQLLDALEDSEANTAAAVAEALGTIGGEHVIDVLKEKLPQYHDDLHRMTYLLDALGRARASLKFEEIEPLIAKRALQRPVFTLLGYSSDPRSIQPVLAGVEKSTWGTRKAAVVALDHLATGLDDAGLATLREVLTPGTKPHDALLETMTSDESDVGAAAARALGRLNDASLSPRILEACAAGGFLQVGVEIVASFGERCLPPLIEAVNDLETDTRVLILETFEALGDDSVLPVCRQIARGEEPRTSEAAVRVLARHGHAEDAAVMADAVPRSHEDLWEGLALGLSQLGARFPAEVAALVAERLVADPGCWIWYAVLGRFKRPEDDAVLRTGLEQHMTRVRAEAIRGLAQSGDRVDPQVFIDGLSDRDPEVRASAARALGAYPRPEVLQELRGAIEDRDPWVVADALRSLGRSGDESARGALVTALGHRASPVVIAAVEGLAEHYPEEFVEAADQLVRHSEREVVRAVVRFAGILPDDKTSEVVVAGLNHEAWDVRLASARVIAEQNISVDAYLLRECLAEEAEGLVRVALQELVDKSEASA